MVKIKASVSNNANAKKLLNLQTQHFGPEGLLVGAKVEFQAGLTTAELAAAVDKAEAAIRSVVPHAHPIYIEPDIERLSSVISSARKDH